MNIVHTFVWIILAMPYFHSYRKYQLFMQTSVIVIVQLLALSSQQSLPPLTRNMMIFMGSRRLSTVMSTLRVLHFPPLGLSVSGKTAD